VFKWAAGEELIPVTIHQALACVSGLQRGRTSARETAPRRPVPDSVVDATLAHLNRHVRGLVEFQWFTGCRPGEAMAVRRCDIEMTGKVWQYKPMHHKTAHKGKGRTIAIGPKAQKLLKSFFTDNAEDYLFSPMRYETERLAERAEKRKTPRYPSHMQRNEEKRAPSRKRPPRERYDRTSYLNAVIRGCDRTFPPTGELARLPGESVAKWKARLTDEQKKALRKWRREHRWFPYQLRHSVATKVRDQFDLVGAQVILGHERADVTQIYAAKNESLAAEIAARIG
jgi:integrase